MKLLIIGHGRHGKDSVSEYLSEKHNLSFESSSRFCSKHFIFKALSDDYENEEECYSDRHNHRKVWYDMICAFNQRDPSLLGRLIFEQHDIYCGLRNKKEYFAMKNNGVFDYAIWVDRSDHLPEESKDSMSLEHWMADYTIDNNGTIEDLHNNIDELLEYLQAPEKQLRNTFAKSF